MALRPRLATGVLFRGSIADTWSATVTESLGQHLSGDHGVKVPLRVQMRCPMVRRVGDDRRGCVKSGGVRPGASPHLGGR